MKTDIVTINRFERPLWTVRIVREGDSYGRNDCLVHDKSDPMVEFYDATADTTKFGPRGQFVSRYYVSTFMSCRSGLDLCGHVPAWTLPAWHVRDVQSWLRRTLVASDSGGFNVWSEGTT